jgi:hypothetical protein
MLSWLNVMSRPEGPYATPVDVNRFCEHWRAEPHHHADRWTSRDGCGLAVRALAACAAVCVAVIAAVMASRDVRA